MVSGFHFAYLREKKTPNKRKTKTNFKTKTKIKTQGC